ncbi:MAG: hypothetical protein WDM77_09905 [Steroidobacteraceae bacterium]
MGGVPTPLVTVGISIVLSAVASYFATASAVKVTLRWLRRDVDRAQATADEANSRINQIQLLSINHP